MEPVIELANQNPLPNQDPVGVPGGKLNRWIASILDNFFIGLIQIPLVVLSEILILGKLSVEETALNTISENPWVIIFALLITEFYKIGFLYKNEATPGKSWRKLKVVQINGFSRINLLKSITREISQVIYFIPLLGPVLYLISVTMFLFSKSRRTLHDYIGGTIVIKQ